MTPEFGSYFVYCGSLVADLLHLREGANRNGRAAAIDPLPTRQQAQEALDKQRPVKEQCGYLTF